MKKSTNFILATAGLILISAILQVVEKNKKSTEPTQSGSKLTSTTGNPDTPAIPKGRASKNTKRTTITRPAFFFALENWTIDTSPTALWNQIETITPDQLPEALKLLAASSINDKLRASLMKSIVANCSTKEKVEKIFAGISANTEKGPLYDELASAAISKSQDDISHLIVFSEGLNDVVSRAHILNGLFLKAKNDGIVSIHEFPIESTPHDVTERLITAISSNLSFLSSSEQKSAINDVFKWCGTDEERNSLLDGFLWNIGTSNPFETFNHLSASKIETSAELRERVYEAMIKEDSEKAASTIIENQKSSTDHESNLRAFFRKWNDLSPEGFGKWLDTHPEIDHHIRDATLAVRASAATSPKEARTFLDKISDPEVKKHAEGKIGMHELRQVKRQAAENPESTINSIINGTSDHGAYWIETAMNEWVAKDRNAAWAWYEANRESLTPEQNEAVALSYARQALQNGQTDLAAEWSRLVVTPKFQSKIRAEIEAAAKDGQ